MLDQISPADTISFCICQQRLYHRKLMVTWEHLLICYSTSILIFFSNDLSIVFNNIGQLILGQNLFPKIIGFDTVWIWRVACTVIKSFVKWQEPRLFSFQLRAHSYLVIIDSKVNNTTLETKQHLIWSTVIFVLFYRIKHILFGKLIFQLHSDYWKTIDKNTYIQSQTRIEAGILQLPSNAENILFVQLGCFWIMDRGANIE